MFSKKCAKLLEESTGERSYGSTSDPSSTEPESRSKTENPALSRSAPEILEPSKDSSRPPKPNTQKTLEDSNSPPINPWRTLVTCSCPEPSTRVPISPNDQSNERADEQLIIDEIQVDEKPGTFTNFIYGYKNAAIKLRNSKFIYVFQLLFSIIPISALVMGVIFSGKCRETEVLPAYGGLTGLIGIAFTGLWMIISCYNRRRRASSVALKLSFLVIFLSFLMFVIVDMCVFGTMSLSFDPQAPNYCDKTFYYYAFYKQIATGVAAVLAMVLYLPGSFHYLFCHCLRSADRG